MDNQPKQIMKVKDILEASSAQESARKVTIQTENVEETKAMQ